MLKKQLLFFVRFCGLNIFGSVLYNLHFLLTQINIIFASGAVVFFDKEPAKVNVINDLNGELINFCTVAEDLGGLKLEVEKTLHSRNQHQHAWYIYQNPDYFTAG